MLLATKFGVLNMGGEYRQRRAAVNRAQRAHGKTHARSSAAKDYTAAMRVIHLGLPVLLAALLGGAPAVARAPSAPPSLAPLGLDLQEVDPYARCLARARSAPLAGYNEAERWRASGGGDAARHCAALALLHGGEPALAAEHLEDLARALRLRPAALRAQVLAQAARAWLTAGDPTRAEARITEALVLAPQDPELRVDRAEIRAAAGRLDAAIADLDHVLAVQPQRAEWLTMRAAAHRRRGALDLARADVTRALAVDPRAPEAWLESGLLHSLARRFDAARRDWLEVLLLDPEGPAAAAARGHIEALELGAAAPPAARPRR